MLKARVLTALVLLPLFIAGLFYLPATGWMLLVAMIILLAWDEWLQLTGISAVAHRISGALIMIAVLAALYAVQPPVMPLALFMVVLWVILLGFTIGTSAGWYWSVPVRRISGLVILITSWWLLCWLRSQWFGAWWVLGFLCIIWLADTGAYFSGRKFGRLKLAPDISPGKTIEGVVGGITLVVIATLLLYWRYPILPWAPMLATTVLVALVSVGGDLYESRLKRVADIKDSGHLLPGHGGVLDRIDSVLAGLPFFVLSLLLIGVFEYR